MAFACLVTFSIEAAAKPRKKKVVRQQPQHYEVQSGSIDRRIGVGFGGSNWFFQMPTMQHQRTASVNDDRTPPPARVRCGWFMRKVFGWKYGKEFNRAKEWLRLPRTAPAPGAVAIWNRGKNKNNGHVARIDRLTKPGYAIVTDYSGTYERRIDNAIGFVRA